MLEGINEGSMKGSMKDRPNRPNRPTRPTRSADPTKRTTEKENETKPKEETLYKKFGNSRSPAPGGCYVIRKTSKKQQKVKEKQRKIRFHPNKSIILVTSMKTD